MKPTTLAVVGPAATAEKKSVLTISKARIKKGLLYCEFTEQTTLEDPARQFTMQGTQPVHDDLVNALDELVPHFVSLTEQLPNTPELWAKDKNGDAFYKLSAYAVTGFSIKADKGGTTLSGQRILAGNNVLTMTAPFVSFDEEQPADYHSTQELEQAIETVLAEVELALRGKCRAAGRQLDMFETSAQLEEEVLRELGEVPEVAPKKRPARRVTE